MKLLTVILGIVPLLAAQDPPKPAEQSAPAEKQAEAAPAPAEKSEKNIAASIDFGYRFHSGIAGNYDAYRTAVNLGEGPKVFGFDLRAQGIKNKLFDHVSLFGLGWGGDPYTTARLSIGKERVYDLNFDYKNIAYFNFLPSYANTMLGLGVLRTEVGYDLRHRIYEGQVRFFPGTRFIPYLGFSRDSTGGSGATTYFASTNEYPVASTSSDATTQVRGGVSIELNKFHATFEEGSTSFTAKDNILSNQKNLGDRTTPVLGQQLYLSSLSQIYRTSGDGYFTKILANFTPYSWMDLSGQFLYSKPKINTTYLESATGNFADISTLQFYTSQNAGLAATANQPHSSGAFYLEVRPMRQVRILESYSGDHLTIPSAYVLNQVTSVYTPANPTMGYTRYETTYNRHQTEGVVDVNKWLTLRAGFRNVWGDLTTRAPQVNQTELEQAKLSQNVALAGFQLRIAQKLRGTFDTEIGSAYKSYFRSSLHNYKKGTARIRYQALQSLALTGSASILYNENPTPGVNYDFRNRQVSLGFQWNPNNAKRYSILGDYTFSSLKSQLYFYAPQNGQPELSNYRENAHTGTMLFDYAAPGGKYAPHLSVGGSMFKSSGSRGTTYVQPTARFTMPLQEHASFFTEWRYYGMGETNFVYEGFRSHLFQIGLRLLR